MIRALLLAFTAYTLFLMLPGLFSNRKSRLKNRLEDTKNFNKHLLSSDDIMSLSLNERLIKPMMDGFIQSVATLLPIRPESQKKLGERLLKAGIKTSPKDYRAMNFIIIIGFAVLGLMLSGAGSNFFQKLIYMVLGLFGGYVFRRYSLESKITVRKKQIKSQLPEVMDILSVSVVAGLSFDQALGYVVERTQGPLIDEFNVAFREITLGKPRKEALKRLSSRCEIDEVTAFTGAINQAEELGISLQNVLNSQSKMIRTAYKQDIEERAAKIPVKILIPMVLFIFPVIFIVLLGPAVPQILNALGNT